MSKMVLLTYERYKNLQGTGNNNDVETSNMDTITKYKDKILAMFHTKDRYRVTGILSFMTDIDELTLDDRLIIWISNKRSTIHVCDFIMDMLYCNKREITPEYAELYSILKSHDIPQKFITNKARRETVSVKKDPQKWLKY